MVENVESIDPNREQSLYFLFSSLLKRTSSVLSHTKNQSFQIRPLISVTKDEV